MKKIIIILITFTYLISDRGDLINAEMISTRNLNNNQVYIDNELSSTTQNQFSLQPIEYGYWMYKITYETINKDGDVHYATGSIAYPRVDWPNVPNEAFPILSYQHGTVVERSSVSSVSGVWILPAFLAGSGYVYLEPDYLGLGDSEGMHPYQIKEPYGTTVVDFIRAAKNYAEINDDFAVNEQLFLVGYSEGGYATMATHQIIERDYSDEFDITVSFPMAGAYSMSEIMVDVMLASQPYGEPFYFPYVLFSYLDSYPEIGNANQYILPEYLFLEDMFDGYHSSTSINESMPSIPIEIMIPSEIELFDNDDNHALKVALRNNDLWDWTPEAPMYIFHGLGDELVPYQNSQMAYDQFVLNGANNVWIELIPESYGGHQDVAPWTLLAAFNYSQPLQNIDCLVVIDCSGECGGNASLDICGDCNGNNESCLVGDINYDNSVDVLDIIIAVDFIFDNQFDSYIDLNQDEIINIFDIILLVEIILNT